MGPSYYKEKCIGIVNENENQLLENAVFDAETEILWSTFSFPLKVF